MRDRSGSGEFYGIIAVLMAIAVACIVAVTIIGNMPSG